MRESGKPLSNVLEWLLSHPMRKNHQLGASRKRPDGKSDGLWLSWMPPHELRLSRPRVVPSPNEVAIVKRHLEGLGYLVSVFPLRRDRSHKSGEAWFWYKLIITKPATLL